MLPQTPEEPFMYRGVSYTEKQVREADDIRRLGDADPFKEALTKCFEVEHGKPFPYDKTLKLGFNMDTALKSSLEIERDIAYLLEHPQQAWQRFPLS